MIVARVGGAVAYDDFEGMDWAMSQLTQGRFGASAGTTDVLGETSEANPELERFVPDEYMPQARGDYPLRVCAASGLYGAPSSMIQVDGLWFLRDYAPKNHLKRA